MIQTTLRHGDWQAEISSLGAELQSLTYLPDDEQFLWHGDGNIWRGRAPILFPVIGRLRNNRIRCRGQSYPLTRHGIARQSDFRRLECTTTAASFRLRDSDRSRSLYPYAFSLEVRFELHEGTLTIHYRVSNPGDDTLWFTLGSHPAFCLPLQDSVLSDYSVALPDDHEPLRYTLVNGLMPAHGTPMPVNPITLSETLFDQDALIFRDIRSREIILSHRRHGTRIVVDTGGAPHLGIWAKPGAPYVCIEPWFGYDDPVDASGDIETKPGMLSLQPGEHWDHSLTIRATPPAG
ncbi:aldose 1-epimerase family protein [Granulosicoccaceae sp. 1_MG-2023]|nr:aldose 1-epimerase family protein [Granulosicoccaceae sp. 1_MG-2023]